MPWPTLRVVLTTSCLALILTAAAGCGPSAKDRALREANIARSRGDLVGEVLHLRRACELDPDDRDVCERAAQVQAHARQQLVMSAQSACNVIGPPRSREPAAVDGAVAALDGCLAAITRIREVSPGDAEAIRLADKAGVVWSDACHSTLAPADSIDGRLFRVQCLGTRAQAIGTPAFAARVGEARTALAAPLLDLAAAAASASRPSGRLAALAAAACVDAGVVDGATLSQARAGHRARSVPGLTVALTRPRGFPGELCEPIAAATHHRVQCAASAAPGLDLSGTLTIEPTRHRVGESTERHDYVAGIDRYENPAYPPRTQDELYSRERMRQAEETWRRDKDECSRASDALSRDYCSGCPLEDEKKRRCLQADTSEDLFEQRKGDWQRASDSLRDTPAVLEREIIRTASYVVRTHEWRTDWRAALRAGALQQALTGSAVTGDTEHPGAPEASIAADPLSGPSDGWYEAEVAAELARGAAGLLDAELRSRAQQLGVGCAGAPQWTVEWLDCWAVSQGLLRGEVGGDALLTLASHAATGAAMPVSCR